MHFAGKTKPAAIRGRRDGRVPDGVPRHGGRRGYRGGGRRAPDPRPRAPDRG